MSGAHHGPWQLSGERVHAPLLGRMIGSRCCSNRSFRGMVTVRFVGKEVDAAPLARSKATLASSNPSPHVFCVSGHCGVAAGHCAGPHCPRGPSPGQTRCQTPQETGIRKHRVEVGHSHCCSHVHFKQWHSYGSRKTISGGGISGVPLRTH